MSAFVPPVGAAAVRSVSKASSVSTRSSTPSLFAGARSPTVSATPLAAPELLGIPHSSGGGPASPGGRGGRVLLLLDFSLRVADNAALAGAVEAARGPGGALVPMAGLRGAPAGAVAELAAALASRGSGLVRAGGDVVAAALDACSRLRLTAVYVNRAGSRDAARMQRRLHEAASDAGLQVVEFGPCGLVGEGRGGEAEFPEFVKAVGDITPAPMEAPDRIPGWLKEAERVGVPGEAKVGEGTSAAMKVLSGLRKEGELRKMKCVPEMGVMLRPFLNCGAVSECMVAKGIVDGIGKLQGATYEELVWRSYVAARYQTLEKIPSGKVVAMA